MKNTKEIFRDNLMKILQDKGLNLTEAAEDCGISLSFLNQMLSGKKAYSPETIDKLAIGLKCGRYEFFITDEEKASLTTSQPQSQEDTGSLILRLLDTVKTMNHDDLETVLTTASGITEIRNKSAANRVTKN